MLKRKSSRLSDVVIKRQCHKDIRTFWTAGEAHFSPSPDDRAALKGHSNFVAAKEHADSIVLELDCISICEQEDVAGFEFIDEGAQPIEHDYHEVEKRLGQKRLGQKESSPEPRPPPTCTAPIHPFFQRARRQTSYKALVLDEEESDEEPLRRPTRRSTCLTSAGDESDFAPEDNAHAEDSDESVFTDEDDVTVDASEPETDPGVDSDGESNKKRSNKAGTKPKASRPMSSAATISDVSGIIKPAPLGAKGHSKGRMHNLTTRGKDDRQLKLDLPPVTNVHHAFQDMTGRALDAGLRKALPRLGGKTLRVATMCSGTESPLLALRMIQEALQATGHGGFDVVHLFSAEIVPYKQAYIERNFNVPIIFRDITELTAAKDRSAKATTAYGARKEVPGDIDLLIAGTACVDYSVLNNKKKSLDDNGESGDTFRAVLAYAKVWRPRMLILENVYGAPWDQMLGFYEAIDYTVAGVFTDTKNYYLPQTRQRGYMFCLDNNICASRSDSQTRVKTWHETMLALKRHASSPAAAFMLPNDDPAVLRARALVARRSMLDDSMRDVDWSRCLIRHIQYRLEEGIGNARPFTSWQESGSVTMPDYADHEWFRAQVERVWDMLDCIYLRRALPAQGDCDVQYKNRIINVSQNVDRNPDNTAPGILPCLTPSGIFFMTDRGATLSPDESLALQGLPLDRISFTTETAKEIQDLAGNAMSTTVVGAAILGALLAVPPSALASSSPQDITSKTAELSQQVKSDHKRIAHVRSQECNLDLPSMLRDAAISAQKCFCEGPFDTTRHAIQTCKDCGHTTCIVCGGKPTHNYSTELLQSKDRLDPAVFRLRWSHMLPSHVRFEFAAIAINMVKRKSLKDAVEYTESVRRALESRYRLDGLRRARFWTAVWSSSVGRLELTLDPNAPTFRLYAICDEKLPANHRTRHLLQSPIAMARVTNGTLFDVTWTVAYAKPTSTDLRFDAIGAQTASWRARLNIPKFHDEKVWTTLSISSATSASIDGSYKHLPNCGTASNGLYKREILGSETLFLMLDPNIIGESRDDSYVITNDPHRISYGRSRDVKGSLNPTWRPWNKIISSSVFTSQQAWFDDHDMSLCWTETSFDLSQVERSSIQAVGGCNTVMELLKISMTPEQASHSNIDALQKCSLRSMSSVFDLARPHLTLDEETPVNDPVFCSSCETCMPSLAPLRWKWASDGKSLRPYEDPVLATRLEEKLKARPAVFNVEVNNQDAVTEINVKLNLATLTHRAVGKLLRRIGLRSLSDGPACTWKIDTNYAETSSIGLQKFTLRSNGRDLELCQPAGLNIELWEMQRRCLTWMTEQENGMGKSYVVEEAEEHLVPDLSWRIEANAKTNVFVKGGIQASHPGFGKTICTLALIAKDFQDRASPAIIAAMPSPAETPKSGRKKLAATLVIAPKHLVKQWASEVENILGKQFANQTTVIANAVDLNKHTIDNLRNARIIILNQDVLTMGGYIRRLAAFAGVPEPNSVRGREYATWLDFVNKGICTHLALLETKGKQALIKEIKQTYAKHMSDPSFQSFIPSKRLKGKAYAEKERDSMLESDDPSTSDAAAKKLPTLSTASLQNIDSPLFEMYHFNRIVIDEFTYLNKKDYASIRNLSADKRWALSATAKLQDPYDIAKMAELIGVKLRVGESAAGALSQQNLKAILQEQTDLERFQTFRTAPSMAVTKRTYELAQEFLDTFVRQNIMESDYFPYQDHLLPVALTSTHRLVYTELSQHLNTSDMRIKKGKQLGNDGRDRESFISEHLQDVESAEEALTRLAATFDNGAQRGEAEGHAIMAKRRAQAESAKTQLSSAVMGISKLPRNKSSTFLSWKDSMIKERSLGDEETTVVLVDVVKHLDKQKDVGGALNTDKMKGQLTLANEKAKHLMATLRSIRFVENAILVKQKAFVGQRCNSSSCESQHSTTVAISSLCGHIICRDCWDICRFSTGICSAQGCRAPIMKYNLLQETKLEQAMADNAVDHHPGAKVQSIIERLEQISSQHDQAILFVQYEDQIDMMKAACGRANIKCVAIKDDSTSANRIEGFQQNRDVSTRATVIILNASNSSAAGINLTNANHVLCLSPLLMDSQYNYDAAMAQAIGRVRRPGQSKRIHVYRFVALDTIDVDVLEHRERRNTEMVQYTDEDASITSPTSSSSSSAVDEEAKPERTQLVRGEDGVFKLVPKSWLVRDGQGQGMAFEGKFRVPGYEDFSSLIKFSKAYSEND